jgi:hypothetical protein
LVEEQPSKVGKKSNNDALMISHQIAYHYIAAGCKRVEFVLPRLKCTLCIGDAVLNTTAVTDAQKYRARKKFTVDCFKNFIQIFKLHVELPKKKDDVSDAAMQALAWLREQGIILNMM